MKFTYIIFFFLLFHSKDRQTVFWSSGVLSSWGFTFSLFLACTVHGPTCQTRLAPKQACFIIPFYFCKYFALCPFSHDKPFPSLLVSNLGHPSLPRVPRLHFTHSFNKVSAVSQADRAENTTDKTPAHTELIFLHLLFPKLPLHLTYNAITV